MTAYRQPCQVRGCEGTLVVYDFVSQAGTGNRLFQFECSTNFRHRAWEIDVLGVLHKEAAPRWARPENRPGNLLRLQREIAPNP